MTDGEKTHAEFQPLDQGLDHHEDWKNTSQRKSKRLACNMWRWERTELPLSSSHSGFYTSLTFWRLSAYQSACHTAAEGMCGVNQGSELQRSAGYACHFSLLKFLNTAAALTRRPAAAAAAEPTDLNRDGMSVAQFDFRFFYTSAFFLSERCYAAAAEMLRKDHSDTGTT